MGVVEHPCELSPQLTAREWRDGRHGGEEGGRDEHGRARLGGRKRRATGERLSRAYKLSGKSRSRGNRRRMLPSSACQQSLLSV